MFSFLLLTAQPQFWRGVVLSFLIPLLLGKPMVCQTFKHVCYVHGGVSRGRAFQHFLSGYLMLFGSGSRILSQLMVSKGLSYSINVMQLLLDYLRFSASSFTAIGKTCFMTDDASAVTVHKFVSEQLNLTKELIMNSKVSLKIIFIFR